MYSKIRPPVLGRKLVGAGAGDEMKLATQSAKVVVSGHRHGIFYEGNGLRC